MENKNIIDRDKVLNLISVEKDNFYQYCNLCKIYQIDLDQRAVAFSRGKLTALQSLLDG